MAKAKDSEPLTLKEFADENETPAQRAYNVMCIASGAASGLFTEFVKKGYLQMARAVFCEDDQDESAFEELVRPQIDNALADNILDKSQLPAK